jgi:hypothetical protein
MLKAHVHQLAAKDLPNAALDLRSPAPNHVLRGMPAARQPTSGSCSSQAGLPNATLAALGIALAAASSSQPAPGLAPPVSYVEADPGAAANTPGRAGKPPSPAASMQAPSTAYRPGAARMPSSAVGPLLWPGVHEHQHAPDSLRSRQPWQQAPTSAVGHGLAASASVAAASHGSPVRKLQLATTPSSVSHRRLVAERPVTSSAQPSPVAAHAGPSSAASEEQVPAAPCHPCGRSQMGSCPVLPPRPSPASTCQVRAPGLGCHVPASMPAHCALLGCRQLQCCSPCPWSLT